MSGFLTHAAKAPRLSADRFLGDRPLVVMAPHADDETLGCGALLFDAAAQGTPCHVICVTDGARSHPRSRIWAAPRLAQTRRAELFAAVAVLAPDGQVTWLGHPDCRAPEHEAAARQVSALVPERALLLATWEGDPHIDHERVARLAMRVAAARPDIALHFYPIWGRFGDRIAPLRLLRASPAARQAKARALACHRSQMSWYISDDPGGFVMEEWRHQHFLTHPEIVIAG